MVSFLVNFLSEPTIVMGLVAMIGLIAMRNSASNVIQGTMKTILGFLILSAGSSLICTALVPFSTMFNAAFGISGVVPEDNALVAAVQTVLGFETPMIMLFSFVINIILARVTPMEIYLPDRTHDVLFCRNYGDCAGQYGHPWLDGHFDWLPDSGNLYGAVSCHCTAFYEENSWHG